ncbi:hypothetical protein FHR92_000270 [Fontibacillus solani]|uniref:Uncharacterized protein n=1 Tax=Fontibacillus solani TaxID=1572857 RepID=A0A7W3SPQ5_9BACL|nr:hypothetical protein [Fontibacillus solani]MBA9083827.1 hypothetical protein [Fontibacillus solani]
MNNETYGKGSVISFFPEDASDYIYNQPNPGDEFVIELKGIYKTDGTPVTIKYTVKNCLLWNNTLGSAHALPFLVYSYVVLSVISGLKFG